MSRLQSGEASSRLKILCKGEGLLESSVRQTGQVALRSQVHYLQQSSHFPGVEVGLKGGGLKGGILSCRNIISGILGVFFIGSQSDSSRTGGTIALFVKVREVSAIMDGESLLRPLRGILCTQITPSSP